MWTERNSSYFLALRSKFLKTEWRQFRMPSWNVIKKVMTGNVIVDGRNIYDRQELEELGFIYTRIGE